jgi:hypothetical protein
MAVLASPDVGVRRRPLLKTIRLASDWPDLRACAVNLTHGRRTPNSVRAFGRGGVRAYFRYNCR